MDFPDKTLIISERLEEKELTQKNCYKFIQ